MKIESKASLCSSGLLLSAFSFLIFLGVLFALESNLAYPPHSVLFLSSLVRDILSFLFFNGFLQGITLLILSLCLFRALKTKSRSVAIWILYTFFILSWTVSLVGALVALWHIIENPLLNLTSRNPITLGAPIDIFHVHLIASYTFTYALPFMTVSMILLLFFLWRERNERLLRFSLLIFIATNLITLFLLLPRFDFRPYLLF